jgi:putative transposase
MSKQKYYSLLLTESHILNHSPELDELTFKCKNLYNKANYILRQEFIQNGKYISKFTMFTVMKDEPEYKCMPVRVSRGVLRTLDGNWLSFFSCIKKWKSNKSLFKGKPNLPNYLSKTGRFTGIFPDLAVLQNKKLIERGVIKLSGLKLEIPVQTKNKIVEVQVIPTKTNKFKINIIYDYKEKELKPNNKSYCSIDLGINNLMTVTSNKQGIQPFIVNGKPLKSINQYYNKTKAEYQSELHKEIYSSKRIQKLTFKRGLKINDYLHKSSKYIVDFCLRNEINTLILGYNEFWKSDVNMKKKDKQNFIQIPFEKLKFMLEFKCKKYGINFITNEESYTSQASFLNLDTIPTYIKGNNTDNVFSGYRKYRGLYKIKGSKTCINSDVNGSYNIMRKVVPTVFINGIEGIAVYPYRVNVY